MTFALASFRAYGIEAEEVVNKRYKQVLSLSITAANTNVAVDIGTYAGTFWTAVGGTAPGINALLAVKDIQTRAKTFLKVAGSGIGSKVQNLATYPSIVSIAGTVAAGSATPAVTAAALQASTADTILSVTQDAKGANSLPLLGYNTQAAGSLVAVYSADPGASGTVKIAVLRNNTTAVPTGTYNVVMNATNTNIPDILFLSGEAPTAYTLEFEWELKDGEQPVEVDG